MELLTYAESEATPGLILGNKSNMKSTVDIDKGLGSSDSSISRHETYESKYPKTQHHSFLL